MNKRIRKKKGLSKITISEIMDLDYAIADFILPRLIRFKAEVNNCPSGLTFEEYLEVLDRMIWSFNYVVKDVKGQEDDRYREGMDLFAEYFRTLWI